MTALVSVKKWTVVDGRVQHPGQILGQMLSSELVARVQALGGRRKGRLFVVPLGDTTSEVYRAADVGAEIDDEKNATKETEQP